jgi:prepilin-type N-terminal cleavage/methylation domain-containing protein
MSGFTLIEVIVTVGIIAVLAAILAVGWPRVREEQALIITQQQVQALLRQAQEQTLNKTKPEGCSEAGCIDHGVALRNRQAVIFTDRAGRNKQYDEGADFVVSAVDLPAQVITNDEWQSLVFVAFLPSVHLYNDKVIVGVDHQALLTFKAGNRTKNYKLFAHGQLQPE